MTGRREFPKSVRLAAFARANGHCEDCTAKIGVGNVEYDHRIPDALGGEPTLENCVVLCRACHKRKSTTQDVPRIAKAKRQHEKHIGARPRPKRPIPGSKASGWKKPLNGPAVRRDG